MNINQAQAKALLELMFDYETQHSLGDPQSSAPEDVFLAFGMIQDAKAYHDTISGIRFAVPSAEYKRTEADWSRLLAGEVEAGK